MESCVPGCSLVAQYQVERIYQPNIKLYCKDKTSNCKMYIQKGFFPLYVCIIQVILCLNMLKEEANFHILQIKKWVQVGFSHIFIYILVSSCWQTTFSFIILLLSQKHLPPQQVMSTWIIPKILDKLIPVDIVNKTLNRQRGARSWSEGREERWEAGERHNLCKQ